MMRRSGLRVALEQARLLYLGLGLQQVAYKVKNGAVEHRKARLHRFPPHRLRYVALAHSGRPHKQHVPLLAHELAGGQLVDLSAVDGRIEGEVEVLQRAGFPKVGHLVAARDQALVAHVEFVLEDQLKELRVGQPVGLGLPQAQLKAAKQSGHAQIQGVAFKGVGYWRHWLGGWFGFG